MTKVVIDMTMSLDGFWIARALPNIHSQALRPCFRNFRRRPESSERERLESLRLRASVLWMPAKRIQPYLKSPS